MHKKHYLLILLLFILVQSGFSQSLKHPYSIYGIGKLHPDNFAATRAMGGLSIAWHDRFSINPLNPAANSSIEFTVFDVGFRNSLHFLSQNDISVSKNYSNLAYFALGFPIHKKAGIGGSFGLMPVSDIGFTNKFESVDPIDSVDVIEIENLKGGFSKFYFGTSFKLFKTISVGANVYYLFGNTSRDHSIEYKGTQFYDLMSEVDKSYGKIGFDLGTQITKRFKDKWEITLGGFYALPVEMNATEKLVIRTLGPDNTYRDSLEEKNTDDRVVTLPLKYGAGILVHNLNKWRFGIDYKATQWSQFKGLDYDLKLNDSWEVIVGGELIPKYNDPNSYTNRIAYRAGIKYAQSYLAVDGADFQLMSLSLGVGLPMVRSASKINVGIEIGQLGKNENNLIKENFVNVNLGLRLNDVWFRKAKID